jgi:hypothetical protein
MRRGFGLIIALLLSSMACGFITTATPSPTRTSNPTPVRTTLALTATPSAQPLTTHPPDAEGTLTQTPAVGVTAAPTQEEPTKTPYPTSVLDSQMTRAINQIQSQVSDERGLQAKSPVPVVLLSPETLHQNVINDFLAILMKKLRMTLLSFPSSESLTQILTFEIFTSTC